MSRQSMELGPEDVSLLERCPRVHFRGCYVHSQRVVSEVHVYVHVSSFQRVLLRNSTCHLPLLSPSSLGSQTAPSPPSPPPSSPPPLSSPPATELSGQGAGM